MQIAALFVFLTSYYTDERIKKNKMGTACGTYRRERGVCWGNPSEREHLEDLHVNGNIALKLILKKYVWTARTGLIWLGIGTDGAGSCEHGSEL